MPAVGRVARVLLAAWFITSGLVVSTRGGPTPPASATPAKVSAERLNELIRQLGHEDFFVRERAQGELERLGVEAFDALNAAENDDDLEVSLRVQYLLRIAQVQWRRAGDTPEAIKLLEQYSNGNEEERIAVIEQFAKLAPPQSVELLCRLVRFEKSHVLARLAALALIEQKLPVEPAYPERLRAIEQAVEKSPRPAASWLRDYVAAERDPAGGAERWNTLVASERSMLQQSPTHTRGEILVRVMKHQVGLLTRLNRATETHPIMLAMLDLQSRDNDQLVDLLNWVVKQQAWPVIDEAAKRYQARFEQEPMLLYTLADACRQQGNKPQADSTADKALKLNPDSSVQHVIAGYKLQRQGWLAWSESEYRLSIKLGSPVNRNTMIARSRLSEMLHDIGRDLDAAKVVEEGIKALDAAAQAGQPLDEVGDVNTSRARMHYFFACAEEEKGNREKQTEHLVKAIAADSLDADVLIGLYRLPGRNEEQKKAILKQINAAADVFRRQIQESPDDATPYNQFAWLVGNTAGDYREALRCSQRSLELQPNTAGYLDTLGRCYYAVGDLDNAIAHQTKAIELDPHSGLMQRQLAFFKAEVAKRGK